MLSLKVTLPLIAEKSYPILINSGLLENALLWTVDFSKYRQIVIITDKIVGKLYANIIKKSIIELINGFNHKVSNNVDNVNNIIIVILEIESGEESKTARTKEWLELEMLQHKLGRDTLCIALGGGVVGDIAGFVSATYMRGIDYIQAPTTFLAMIDSSVGGKTAIDTSYGKNLIGAFWQPKAVIIDLNCLASLPHIHLVSGLVEAIKIFLTSNAMMFEYVKKHITEILNGNKYVITHIIAEAIKLKSNVVERDEREKNLRMILNFGHTIGHGLEFITNYELLHGYAVAFGIIIEAKIAVEMGVLVNVVVDEVINLFRYLGIIDVINDMLIEQLKYQSISQLMHGLLTALLHDKKNKDNQVYCVLLKQIGEVSVNDGGMVVTSIPMTTIHQILFNYISNVACVIVNPK